MKDFKLLSGFSNDEEIDRINSSSWIFVSLDNVSPNDYEIVTEYHFGIWSFLSQFDSHQIIPVLSITGPNQVVHNISTLNNGWGFEIVSDPITIKWVRLLD